MVQFLLAAVALLTCEPERSSLIAAHRGGMDSGHPENTLPAFRHAAEAGAHVLELDLRATQDGEIVVLHDPTVNRTTNGHGAIHELSLSKVKTLDAGNGATIPTLTEVLEEIRPLNVQLLLDIKRANGLRHVDIVNRAAALHDLERVLFGVRSLDDRRELARAHPKLRFLGFVPRPGSIDDFLGAGVEAIRLWPGWIARRPELVDGIHRAGAQVWVTAGRASVEEINALIALGIDGILTDRPAEAAAALQCRSPLPAG